MSVGQLIIHLIKQISCTETTPNDHLTERTGFVRLKVKKKDRKKDGQKMTE